MEEIKYISKKVKRLQNRFGEFLVKNPDLQNNLHYLLYIALPQSKSFDEYRELKNDLFYTVKHHRTLSAVNTTLPV